MALSDEDYTMIEGYFSDILQSLETLQEADPGLEEVVNSLKGGSPYGQPDTVAELLTAIRNDLAHMGKDNGASMSITEQLSRIHKALTDDDAPIIRRLRSIDAGNPRHPDDVPEALDMVVRTLRKDVLSTLGRMEDLILRQTETLERIADALEAGNETGTSRRGSRRY